MFYQQSDSYNRINSFLKCYWNVMTRLCVVRWFKIEETQSQKYWISTKLTPQWLSVHPSQTLLKRYLESWARTTWNQKTGSSICTNLKTFLKYPLCYGFQACPSHDSLSYKHEGSWIQDEALLDSSHRPLHMLFYL